MLTQSLWDVYDEIMQDTSRWCYFSELKPSQTSQDLFTGTNALEYIKSTYIIGGKSKVLDITYDDRFEMTQYRSNHTLSAYLLGIALRDKLKIDMRELPKISTHPTKNFLYFWSLTCLYHDFAYYLEEASSAKNSIYRSRLKSLQDFIHYFQIEYSLLEHSADRELISNYYDYIINKHKHVDHGIAGAMLFFNAMMKEYHEARKESGTKKNESFVYNGKKFSKDYIKHIVLISTTIAKHNMWRAKPETQVDFETYKLFELIPKEDDSHKVSFDDNSENDKEKLLFLLGLVDTLEPIKNLGRDKNKNPLMNPYIVLEKIKVKFDSKNKKVNLYCPQPYKEDYENSIKGIVDWMNVGLDISGEVFTISFPSRKAYHRKAA